jgi:hypothetical protein
MDFIEFVTSLAPEGETVLFVQQKTKAWIPQLPGAKRAEGKAWYVSSGSFILDRMTDGLSASTANCTHVTFLAVDDVGTKSKVPPLEPTWKIESSPGNYQWAWVLSEQVPVAVADAAERAFAEAGYTDEGAINAVRNWRIPGSDQHQAGPQPLRLRPDRVPPRARFHRRAGLRRAGRDARRGRHRHRAPGGARRRRHRRRAGVAVRGRAPDRPRQRRRLVGRGLS